MTSSYNSSGKLCPLEDGLDLSSFPIFNQVSYRNDWTTASDTNNNINNHQVNTIIELPNEFAEHNIRQMELLTTYDENSQVLENNLTNNDLGGVSETKLLSDLIGEDFQGLILK